MTASRRYRGLLIGNTSFPRDPHALPKLHGPGTDLKELRRALTDERTGLFAPENISELRDCGVQELREALHEFFIESAERDDVLLLYYSGHGKLDLLGNLHLCAEDSKTSSLPVTALRYKKDIESLIDESPATTTVVVLDCCYSGAFRGGDAFVNATGRGKCVISSARATELALDSAGEGGPSPFTGALIQGLKLAEASGRLTTRQLYDHIGLLLSKTRNATPQFHFDGEGEIVIAGRATGPDSPPPRASRTGPQAEPDDGPKRSNTTRSTLPEARNWRESILNEAVTAAFEEPEDHERLSAVHAVMERAADADVEWAERLVLALPYGDLRQAATAGLCRRLAEANAERAMRFVSELPDDAPGKVEQLIALAEAVAADNGPAFHLLSEAVRCSDAMPDGMLDAAVVLARLAAVFKLADDPELSERVAAAADEASRKRKAAMLAAARPVPWDHATVLTRITARIDAFSSPSRRGRLLVSAASELGVAAPGFALKLLVQADQLVPDFHAGEDDLRVMASRAASIIELSADVAHRMLDLVERLVVSLPPGEDKLGLLVGMVEELASRDLARTERLVLEIERMAARLPEDELGPLWLADESLASVAPDIAERLVYLIPDDKDRLRALVPIVKQVRSESPQTARRLADEAERIARSMVTDGDRFHAMVDVAEAYAAVDLDYAVRFLRSAPLQGSKLAVAYQRAASALAETAPERIQEFIHAFSAQGVDEEILCDIAPGVARVDPERALALVRHLPDGSIDKMSVLAEVVEALGSVAPARAKEIAESIQDEYYRARALSTLVKAVADSDPHYAARLSRSIPDEEGSGDEKVSAMVTAAMALHPTDALLSEELLATAERCAYSIDDGRMHKANALMRVAQGFVAIDRGRTEHLLIAAERLAHTIEDEYADYRSSTLGDIMVVWAAIAPGQVERLMAVIPDSWAYKDMCLRETAEVLARTGSRQVERFVGMIADESSRMWAIRKLVNSMASAMPARAERLASELPAGMERALALADIAKEAYSNGMR